MIMGRILILFVFFALLSGSLILTASSGKAGETGRKLLMATTTSTDNTSLLDYLMPSFTTKTGIGIQWISTGTGKALKLGENCDVDVLLVHAPQAEIAFVNKGYGMERRKIMYNDFVLIGPSEDPANIKGRRVSEAMQAIGSSADAFVSRGDNSGTNKKERTLWKLAHMPIPDQETWYKQSGQGMLATIHVAAELKGYTLTDRGTYIKYESVADNMPALNILVEGDEVLLNQYSVIPVNPKHCSGVKYKDAKALSAWLAGPEAQGLIREFKLLGKHLFIPNADQE